MFQGILSIFQMTGQETLKNAPLSLVDRSNPPRRLQVFSSFKPGGSWVIVASPRVPAL